LRALGGSSSVKSSISRDADGAVAKAVPGATLVAVVAAAALVAVVAIVSPAADAAVTSVAARAGVLVAFIS